ncbi:hypothetical protein HW45_02605 [Vibrio sp. ER1A]|nr:hypothetical protein HW45_02605 [Vibrio sp. ER1A]
MVRTLNLKASTYFKIGLISRLAFIGLGVFAFVNFEAFLKYSFTSLTVKPEIRYFILSFGVIGFIYHSVMLYRCKASN